MPDSKLFRISGGSVVELLGKSAKVEKSLQTLIEKHLEAFLGVRLLASEFSTGSSHGGRMDTLGIDENGCPVIIEYKRETNENVINQGLFYLDWLMDHKGDFQVLVMKKLGDSAAQAIDWSAPRLLCIAGNFTTYDEHAIKQINRNIELIRYLYYGDDLLMLELVNQSTASKWTDVPTAPGMSKSKSVVYKTAGEQRASAGKDLVDRFEALQAFLLALGDDVQLKELLFYFAFKRLKNFVCVEFRTQKNLLLLYLKVNPDTVDLAGNKDFFRDVRNIGHYGTGDLEITIQSDADLEKAKPYMLTSYDLA